MGGGNARGLAKTDVAPINHFVQWFQAISANMNAEAQRRALSALQKAAFSVFINEGDDEDLYSAEMAEIGFFP